MTFDAYRRQFNRNLKLMSRTVNGTLSTSSSPTKSISMATNSAEEANKLALENTDRALEFLFSNRRKNFDSAKDLEEFILQTAQIVNKGIVKEGYLFRNGEDCKNITYVKIKDLPEVWEWFIKTFYWMLTNSCFSAEGIAAFCEYVINITGHFFSDGCGKTSMLISTYVFMRFDLPCVIYTSMDEFFHTSARDEYYHIGARSEVPTVSVMRHIFADPEYFNFRRYYLNMCPSRKHDFYYCFEKYSTDKHVCYLMGYLTDSRCIKFRRIIENIYKVKGPTHLIFNCSRLIELGFEGAEFFKDLKESGKSFEFRKPNITCKVLLKIAGLESYLEKGDGIPEIDLGNCTIISEGATGIIYRISDEVVGKLYKGEPDYKQIFKTQKTMRNLLVCGVPAPFSLGYAEYDGKIVSLMELIDSKSLLQILKTETDRDKYFIEYVKLVKSLHAIHDEEKLKFFDKNSFGNEILEKSDRVDRILPVKYKGRARKIIENISEQECLVHGDIHPNNFMMNKDGLLFIDLDSFSTGKAIQDLGELYRTLFLSEYKENSEFNSFLKIPMDISAKIWNGFFSEYYKDKPEAEKQKKLLEAAIIGRVLYLAKSIKLGISSEKIDMEVLEFEKSIDEYEKLP